MLWQTREGKHIAVEYASDEDHGWEPQRKKDLKRTNELAATGITTFTLLSEHLMNTAKMDEMAFQIAMELNRDFPLMTPEAYTERDTLRSEIAASLDRFKGLVS